VRQLEEEVADVRSRLGYSVRGTAAVNAETLERLGVARFIAKPFKLQTVCALAKFLINALQEEDATPSPSEEALPSGLYTVLLVEDTELNQMVAGAMLEKLGVAMDVAEDGLQALDALRAKYYDLVLMDCQMPNMDGYQATQAIREEQAAFDPHIPVLAMTAHAMQGDKEKCLAAGMDDYLTKPIRYDLLRAALLKWLPKDKRPQAGV